MVSAAGGPKKGTSTWKFVAIGIVALGLCSALLVSSRRKGVRVPESPKPPPPDLSSCTRVEVRYRPSALKFICASPEEESVLSSEEKQYLQSLGAIVVDDPNRIRAFADDVALGTYEGVMRGLVNVKNTTDVVCYRDDQRVTSFKVWGGDICTEDMLTFKCDKGLPSLLGLTPQVLAFAQRVECMGNLSYLHPWLRGYSRTKKAYPAAWHWCDALVEMGKRMGKRRGGGVRPEHFKCPGGPEGKCNYAINPYCEPNSPPDTVLLFETKVGWNQHGGPELFTFDNHDPKGGCILLNDGQVKFIRTDEELRQLRWK